MGFSRTRIRQSGWLRTACLSWRGCIMMTGMVSMYAYEAHSLSSDTPSVSGIQMSSNTRSYIPAARAARACVAFSIGRHCARASFRISDNPGHGMPSSSSTTRMFAMCMKRLGCCGGCYYGRHRAQARMITTLAPPTTPFSSRLTTRCAHHAHLQSFHYGQTQSGAASLVVTWFKPRAGGCAQNRPRHSREADAARVDSLQRVVMRTGGNGAPFATRLFGGVLGVLQQVVLTWRSCWASPAITRGTAGPAQIPRAGGVFRAIQLIQYIRHQNISGPAPAVRQRASVRSHETR